MSQSALRRAVWVSLALVLVGALSGGAVRFVSAMFLAQTSNPNTQWGDSWLGPATGLGATYSGNNVTVSWTPGGSPLVTSQTLFGYLLSPQPTDSARSGNNLSVTNGSTTVTSATANWTAADVGKTITIGTTSYSIASVTSTTTADLATSYAGSTATNVAWYLATGICPAGGSASYSTTVAAIANDTTATATDTNRASGNNGKLFCYELAGNSTTYSSWTAYSTLVAQPGLAATRVLVTNVATGAQLKATDTITITWNQRTRIANGTVVVCSYTNGTILIGDTGSTCAGSTDGYTVAKLVESTGSLGTATIRYATSTISSTTSAPFTSLITIAGSASTAATSGTPTWTLTPATSIQSNASTTVTACGTGAYCTPTTTSNF